MDVPVSIGPSETVTASLLVTGATIPSIRSLTVVLEGSRPEEALTIPVSFGTGTVPVLLPAHAIFRREHDRLSASVNLWLEAAPGDVLSVEESSFGLGIVGKDGVRVIHERAAILNPINGLCRVPIRLSLQPDSRARGVGSLKVQCGEQHHEFRLPFSVSAGEAVTVSPATADVYIQENFQAVLDRVFIVTAPFPFVPEIVEPPACCTARLEKVSDRSWKLVAVVDPNAHDKEISVCEITIACRSLIDGRTFTDGCIIRVRRSPR
ncbi:hypothetical protein [Maioricimonas rarisocia]|uniref:hypothetical protein n=1 Tax=Maioricimonas rarisocia TaxID=2528026 RepID=UPI0018D270CF|nr:hypothetical protein [Maioricimonas rarisocia]